MFINIEICMFSNRIPETKYLWCDSNVHTEGSSLNMIKASVIGSKVIQLPNPSLLTLLPIAFEVYWHTISSEKPKKLSIVIKYWVIQSHVTTYLTPIQVWLRLVASGCIKTVWRKKITQTARKTYKRKAIFVHFKCITSILTLILCIF